MLVAKVYMPLLAAFLWWWMHSLWLELGVPLQGGVLTGVQAWMALSSVLLFLGYHKLARDHHSGADLQPVTVPECPSERSGRSHMWSAGIDPLVSGVAVASFLACFFLFNRGQDVPALAAAGLGVLAALKNTFFRTLWSCDETGLVSCGSAPRARLNQLRAVVLQGDALQVCLLHQDGRLTVCHQDQASKYRRHKQVLEDVRKVAQGIHKALDLPWLAELGHYEVQHGGGDWRMLGSKLRPSSSLATIGTILVICTPLLAVLDMFFLNLLLTRLG